jgi:hypothetical protein
MNLLQKVLRKPVNFIVEKVFPNHAFYGKNYVEQFKQLDKEDGIGHCVMTYLLHQADHFNATDISLSVEDVSIKEINMGDWKFTLTQEKKNNEFPRPLGTNITGLSMTKDFETGEVNTDIQYK